MKHVAIPGCLLAVLVAGAVLLTAHNARARAADVLQCKEGFCAQFEAGSSRFELHSVIAVIQTPSSHLSLQAHTWASFEQFDLAGNLVVSNDQSAFTHDPQRTGVRRQRCGSVF